MTIRLDLNKPVKVGETVLATLEDNMPIDLRMRIQRRLRVKYLAKTGQTPAPWAIAELATGQDPLPYSPAVEIDTQARKEWRKDQARALGTSPKPEHDYLRGWSAVFPAR